jgi:hypothetical protein
MKTGTRPGSHRGRNRVGNKGRSKAQKRARHAERVRKARTATKLKLPPVPAKPIRADVQRLESRLPKISYAGILNLFRNALSILTDPKRRALHASAHRVLAAINNEWARRAQQPVTVEGFFQWPSTDAPGGDGLLSARGWLSEGMLGFMEYRVGRTNGTPTSLRQMLLAQVFTREPKILVTCAALVDPIADTAIDGPIAEAFLKPHRKKHLDVARPKPTIFVAGGQIDQRKYCNLRTPTLTFFLDEPDT